MSEAIVRQVISIVSGRRRGSIGRLAATLGVAESTVRTWTTAGRIPAKWQPVLMELARERGLPLQPRHFFELDDDDAPPADNPGHAPAHGAWAA